MSKESLVLHNPHHEIISFRVDKGIDDHIAGLSRHKQKRLIRCFSHNVALPSRVSVDLVPFTGLTVKEIKESTEYLQMQKYFQVMYDSSLVTDEIEEPDDVDPIDAEDIDGIQLEDKADTLDELLQEEYPDAVMVPNEFEDEDSTEPVEVPPLWTAENITTGDIEDAPKTGKHDEAEMPGAMTVEDLATPDVVEPEPEPEPEVVEEPVEKTKPGPKKKATPKKRKPAKKTKKKPTKRSTKKGK